MRSSSRQRPTIYDLEDDMHRKSIGRLTVSAALAFMLFASAPAVAQQGTGQSASSDVRQKVLVRFTWKLKAEYVPLFVALDKGYYAAEGLDVQLAEGSGPTTVVKVIAIGTEQF